MCELTKDNFKEKLSTIKQSLEKAKFIAVDLEFSALRPLQTHSPSLFDSPKERYNKLRKHLEHVVPLQVGLTAFHFNNETCDYYGEVFTFYVFPPAFASLDKAFYMQASSINFLCLHDFDFNKFAYLGIPYLNKLEEGQLRSELSSDSFVGENCLLNIEFKEVAQSFYPIINKWYSTCKEGDYLEIGQLPKQYKNFYEIIYFMHTHLRNRFRNLWSYEKDGSFFVKKVSNDDLKTLLKTCKLHDNILEDLTGFTHVFQLLTSLKKPIIGQNILQDLMIMINNFENPLPESYSQFKRVANQLFPTVFDTKMIYYSLRRGIEKEKLPDDTSLEALFNYFKDGIGRHLAVNTSAIESNIKHEDLNDYHQAGWDSFCAGYIFIRMGYYNVALNFPPSRKFVPQEIIHGLREYKNCINVIRGSTSYIRIDGEDPETTRPPWLVIENLKREPVDLSDLTSLLSSYGFIDVKKISSRGDRVLVAVDTYRAARDISRTLSKNNPKIQVRPYSVFRHSTPVQAVVIAAVTISGSILLWLTSSLVRKR